MSANKFIDNPPAIIVWSPLEKTPPAAFVVLGDVPSAILNACSQGNGSVLRDYYGANYKDKLLIGTDLSSLIPKWVSGGADETDVVTNNVEDGPSMNISAVNTLNAKIHPVGGTFDGGCEICGGDDELDEIEQLLSADVRVHASKVKVQGAISVQLPLGVTYVRDVAIYPEDKYDELKNKIYLATGIPPYRQHLFYFENNRPQTLYKLYTDGIVSADIRALSATGSTTIHGIPIDKSIYDQREISKVESMDTFQTLGDTLPLDNRIFVVDLGAITNVRRTQLLELLKDTYQFELLYYGAILKYWPQLTLDCFRDYIADETDLQNKYPDLAPTLSTLRTVHKAERAIVDANYRNMSKLLAFSESGAFGLAITQMIAQVNGSGIMLNIRNVFEYFHTSMHIPEIRAWVDHENRKYLLVKKHVQSDEILFPTAATLRTGITFAISVRAKENAKENAKINVKVGADSADSADSADGADGADSADSADIPNVQEIFRSDIDDPQGEIHGGESSPARYMFLNIWPSGRYHIKSSWNEEDELGFDETTAVMKKHVDPIIAEINKLGYYAFISMGKLAHIHPRNLTYQSLTICLFWKRVMTDATYKLVRARWDPYFRAQIVGARNVQQFDKYELMLQKGMYQFDNTAIERIISASNNITMNNYYAHLSNQQIGQKWRQNYSGRVLRMSHRTTDIRFEISDIREQEFKTAQVYILGFIYSAAHDSEIRASLESRRDYTDVKKLRKLREQDPELYNLRKHGSKKVYSIVCQNQRQPIIYTDDELRSMSAKDKQALVEYWNFTLGRPAWYGCPSRQYPHLSFMVGVHPKHYCLPCCNKKLRTDDESRKARVNTGCLRNHEWKDEADGGLSRHIMNYGKDIEVGRLSRLPQTSLKNLLHDTLDRNGSSRDRADDATRSDRADPPSDHIIDNAIGSAIVSEHKVGAAERDAFGYYLFGVPQHYPGAENMGIIYSIAAAVNMSQTDYIRGIVRGLGAIAIDTLLRGLLTEYFRTSRDLAATMHELFVEEKVMAAVRIPYWPELFIELTQIVYGIAVVTFIDSTGTGVGISLHAVESVKNAIAGGNMTIAVVMKRENNYYPMFVLDPDAYFRRFEINLRTYSPSSGLARLLRTMVKPTAKGVARLNLQLIKDFCAAGGFNILCKFVNQHNLCYGVAVGAVTGGANAAGMPSDDASTVIGGALDPATDVESAHDKTARDTSNVVAKITDTGKMDTATNQRNKEAPNVSRAVYVPCDYSTNLPDGIPILAIPNDATEYPLGETIALYSKISNYTRDLGIKIEIVKLLYFNEVLIGARTTVGTAYVTAGEVSNLPTVPIEHCSFDFRDVNRAIAERQTPTEDGRSRIGEALYTNYRYQLLIIEFVNYLDRERNDKLRAQIYEMIADTNFKRDLSKFRAKLRELVPPADYATLQSQISAFYSSGQSKSALKEAIESRSYEFDRGTLLYLQSLDPEKSRAELFKIASTFAVEGVPEKLGEFPNIYLPCEESHAGYCSGKKLILTGMDKFVSVLASDIRDELRVSYLLNNIWMDAIVDMFKFTKVPTEIVSVYRLTD